MGEKRRGFRWNEPMRGFMRRVRKEVLEVAEGGGNQMTVKDLKEKLAMLPEDAKVFFVTSRTDNLTEDFYTAEGLIYLEVMEEGGIKAAYITP